MLTIEKSVREISGLGPGEVPENVLKSSEPLLLKGMVAEWPVVQAAKTSAQSADLYLRQFYQGCLILSAPKTGCAALGSRYNLVDLVIPHPE